MDTVGKASTFTITSSAEAGHTPLEMVQLSVAEEPGTNPEISEVGDPGVSIVAVPDTKDQVPLPIPGALPSRTVVVILHNPWPAPASEVVGGASMVTTTSSSDEGQKALEMVHFKVTVAPITRSDMVDVGEVAEIIVAEPETRVQVPIPVIGLFPERSVLVTLHKDISVPASAVDGGASTVIIISSEEGLQDPLDIVHRNVAEEPTNNPVTSEVGEAGVVMLAVPDTTVQTPVPTEAVFPAKVVVVRLHNTWSELASATSGNSFTLTTISSSEAVHVPLETVHLKVVAGPPITNPVIPEEGEAGVVMVAVPDINVHRPVPTKGVFPDNVAVVISQRS